MRETVADDEESQGFAFARFARRDVQGGLRLLQHSAGCVFDGDGERMIADIAV